MKSGGFFFLVLLVLLVLFLLLPLFFLLLGGGQQQRQSRGPDDEAEAERGEGEVGGEREATTSPTAPLLQREGEERPRRREED